MATNAEIIVDTGKLPDDWQLGVDEMMGYITPLIKEVENDPDHELAQKNDWHGLHAYRYEVCGDDSVVAVYANDSSGSFKLKAFSNIEEASLWSPRDERATHDS